MHRTIVIFSLILAFFYFIMSSGLINYSTVLLGIALPSTCQCSSDKTANQTCCCYKPQGKSCCSSSAPTKVSITNLPCSDKEDAILQLSKLKPATFKEKLNLNTFSDDASLTNFLYSNSYLSPSLIDRDKIPI